MNTEEFAALKQGDQIDNPMSGGRGEVVTVDATGVRISWLGAGRQTPDAGTPTWHYSVNSTAWMHWTKAEPDNEAAT
jgi:hypothetical protein